MSRKSVAKTGPAAANAPSPRRELEFSLPLFSARRQAKEAYHMDRSVPSVIVSVGL